MTRDWVVKLKTRGADRGYVQPNGRPGQLKSAARFSEAAATEEARLRTRQSRCGAIYTAERAHDD